MKIDPYKHQERYYRWKNRVKCGIPNISRENSDLILKYLGDMEKGINIASTNVKGSRGFIRLISLRIKCFIKSNGPNSYSKYIIMQTFINYIAI